MSNTYAAMMLQVMGYPDEAADLYDRAYDRGPLGQSSEGPAWSYYGTRACLGTATAATAAAVGVGIAQGPAPSFFKGLRQFFWDSRAWSTVSREYWRGSAAGRTLHHWLIPQKASWVPQGLRNAGFNLLRMPASPKIRNLDVNRWMGFAQSPKWSWANRWLDKIAAPLLENAIRFAIPGSLGGAGYAGSYVGDACSGDTQASHVAPPPPPSRPSPPPRSLSLPPETYRSLRPNLH